MCTFACMYYIHIIYQFTWSFAPTPIPLTYRFNTIIFFKNISFSSSDMASLFEGSQATGRIIYLEIDVVRLLVEGGLGARGAPAGAETYKFE